MVPVLKSLYTFILSITQGPTIWVPGLLGEPSNKFQEGPFGQKEGTFGQHFFLKGFNQKGNLNPKFNAEPQDLPCVIFGDRHLRQPSVGKHTYLTFWCPVFLWKARI